MKPEFRLIVMVGAFPPPLHGMAGVNAEVCKRLRQAGTEPLIINLAAASLSRSITSRLERLPRVLRGLVRLAFTPGLSGSTLYMSLSGGWGQVYELAFVVVARLRRMRMFLHHHSFAYVQARTSITRILTKTAASRATHIAQSPRMAARLQLLYGVGHLKAVSNAVFLQSDKAGPRRSRRELRSIGFMSNIAEDKGIFEFLDVMTALEDAKLGVKGLLAGPFQDIQTERAVRARLRRMPSVHYAGSVYGQGKEKFLDSIDILLFPTRYEHETEGIVNHEAMSRGIPVIACGRGCIPEIVGNECGRIISPDEPFVPAALSQIDIWTRTPALFERTSRAARSRFAQTYNENSERWEALLVDLLGIDRVDC